MTTFVLLLSFFFSAFNHNLAADAASHRHVAPAPVVDPCAHTGCVQ